MRITQVEHTQYQAPSVNDLQWLLRNEYGCRAKNVAADVRKMWKVRDPARLPADMFELFQRKNRAQTSVSLDEIKMFSIDYMIGTHGIEYLGQTKVGQDVHYANAGDTYTPTIIFIGSRMTIDCWGDVVAKPGFRSRDRFSGFRASTNATEVP